MDDGLPAPSPRAVGARFRGHNRSASSRWSTTNTILTADPPHEIAWLTHYTAGRDRTEWRYVLEPTRNGTRITQVYRVIAMPWWFDRAVWILTPAHHDRREALRGDLLRLGELAARPHRAPHTAEPATIAQ